MRYRRADLPLKLDGLATAHAFFAAHFAELGNRHERLLVAHLDEGARCLHVSRFEGGENGMAFPLRAVLLDAAQHGSVALVLAHNHPSGDPRPSIADCRTTRRLVSAAEAIDCAVLDHLIFAGAQCTSFRRVGLL
jgi:DNA repair protein RadC